jgi:curved DNA-binding protein CbpA
MNLNTAQHILNIKIPYSKHELKKAYMNAALKYHPDKSKNPDANIIFNNVTQAYHYLNDLLDKNIINEEDYKNNEDNSYFSLISQFFSMAFISNDSIDTHQVDKLINSLKNDCKEFSLKVIEDFNPETLFKLWDYIIRFKDLFNFSEDTLNKIQEIIKKKLQNNQIFILNPNLNNILNNDTFKLMYEGEQFLVPLWRDFTYFKLNNNDYIYVKTIPNLPDNYYITRINNIYNLEINYFTNIEYLLKNNILIDLPNQKINIQTHCLNIKKYQKVIYKKNGIINYNDQLDIVSIGDIIIHLYIDFFTPHPSS